MKAEQIMMCKERRMRDNPSVTELVSQARNGDKHAWNALIERYAPLVWSICQRLLALLIQDPPASYAEISARLGISIGSIGPIRSRCVDRMRRHPALAALINAAPDSAGR